MDTYSASDNLVNILLGVLITSPVWLWILWAMWSAGQPIPSVGEAQAVQEAPAKHRPAGASLGQVAVRIAAGYRDEEADETDGGDDAAVPDDDEDEYERQVPSFGRAVDQPHPLPRVEPAALFAATGTYPVLDDAALHSGMTGAFLRLTPERLAEMDAARLLAEVAA